MNIYSVRNWKNLYETSETRKLKRLNWVPIPNKHDGNGFRRLMNQSDPGNLFTAFILIIEVASKMDERGVLKDPDGPLTAQDLAFKTGFHEKYFKRAFSILTNSQLKIEWLVVTDEHGKPLESAEITADSGKFSCSNGMEGKGREGKRKKLPKKEFSEDVLAVIEAYRKLKRIDTSRWAAKDKIKKLLKEQPVEKLLRAIRNYGLTTADREEKHHRNIGNFFGSTREWEEYAADDWQPPQSDTPECTLYNPSEHE